MQPLILDTNGVVRFKANSLVTYLVNFASQSNMGVEYLWKQLPNIPEEDKEQFAQLIGYPVIGFGDLPFVSTEAFTKALKQRQKLLAKEKGSRK